MHKHDKKPVVNRLSRAIGHLQSVKGMVEDERDCTEIVNQLEAVKSAIANTQKVILKEHMSHCIVEAAQNGDYQKIEDLKNCIEKML